MTTADHLPECLHSRPCERAVRGTGDRHVVSGGRCDNCDDPCICDRLRACTVRVLGEVREVVVAKRDYWRRAALRQTASDLRRGFKAYADAHDAESPLSTDSHGRHRDDHVPLPAPSDRARAAKPGLVALGYPPRF